MFRLAFKHVDAIFIRFPFIGKNDRRSLNITFRRYKVILLIFGKSPAKSFRLICNVMVISSKVLFEDIIISQVQVVKKNEQEFTAEFGWNVNVNARDTVPPHF